SPKALEVARKNASLHKAERISFIQSDLLDKVRQEKMDIIVANLPYIGSGENHLVSRDVLEYEPSAALFGGGDGLDLYERLFQQLSGRAQKPLCLIAEIGFLHKERLETMVRKYFPNARFQFHKDLAELDRMLVIEFLR
ncbi:methyltransferase, partial [Candidatus Peregrinibacteria bacterium]|nr:methyltransferase [Candidatus Peregrinibacteria bacterium]